MLTSAIETSNSHKANNLNLKILKIYFHKVPLLYILVRKITSKNEIDRKAKVTLENINKDLQINYNYSSGILEQQSLIQQALRKLETKANSKL